MLIALYLIAIVAANLLVAWLGKPVVAPVAFGLIGLNFVTIDQLHDEWLHKQLALRMLFLIGCGSVLSYLLNAGAGRVGVASFAAFAASMVLDRVTYHAALRLPFLARSNISNVFGTIIDSFVFITLAFGWPPAWGIIGMQIIAKLLGSFIWSLVLWKLRARAV